MPHRSTPLSRRWTSCLAVALVTFGVGGRVASASVSYNRAAAVNYAAANWNKVVSDGYFWTDSGTCAYYGAGVAAPTGGTLASGVGDDCAHFVSSCIGAPSGAGLPVLQPFATSTTASYKAQYGDPSASGLAAWLVSSGDAIDVSGVSKLSAGDVIAYDWNGNNSIDHIALYLGNNTVSAHATSHYGVNYDLGKGTYPSEVMTYIHITVPDAIVPEPTTLAGVAAGLLAFARRPRR